MASWRCFRLWIASCGSSAKWPAAGRSSTPPWSAPPIQHFIKEDKAQLDVGKMPEDWSAAKRGQKDLDATETKKHGKRYHGHKLSISVNARYKFIHSIATSTARECA